MGFYVGWIVDKQWTIKPLDFNNFVCISLNSSDLICTFNSKNKNIRRVDKVKGGLKRRKGKANLDGRFLSATMSNCFLLEKVTTNQIGWPGEIYIRKLTNLIYLNKDI